MSWGELPRNQVLVGDARKRLGELPELSVDCVITSPPFFQLRNYQVEGQIGLEDHVEAWVDELCLVMAGIARVLKPTGSVWLNLGDSFSRHAQAGAPSKSLLLGPERLGLALIGEGWMIRNKVIWAKTNAMPNSVRDRLACSWEVLYLLTRSERYYFDLDAIRVPHRSRQPRRRPTAAGSYPPHSSEPPSWAGPLAGNNSGLARLKAQGLVGHPLGGNPRDVWSLPTSNFRGAFFASFPPGLVVKPLLASAPERVCVRCGKPWSRGPVRIVGGLAVIGELRRICRCRAAWQRGIVLDPFCGSGTVGLVAEQHHRDWLGIELNPNFAKLAEERIAAARCGPTPDRQRHAA